MSAQPTSATPAGLEERLAEMRVEAEAAGDWQTINDLEELPALGGLIAHEEAAAEANVRPLYELRAAIWVRLAERFPSRSGPGVGCGASSSFLGWLSGSSSSRVDQVVRARRKQRGQ